MLVTSGANAVDPKQHQEICGFLVMCSIANVEPRTNLFSALFILKRDFHSNGWWVIGPRSGHRVIKDMPSAIHGWKPIFVFVLSFDPWGFDTVWKKPHLTANDGKKVLAVDQSDYDLLVNSEVAPIRELLEERNLHLAGINESLVLGISGRGFRSSSFNFSVI